MINYNDSDFKQIVTRSETFELVDMCRLIISNVDMEDSE